MLAAFWELEAEKYFKGLEALQIYTRHLRLLGKPQVLATCPARLISDYDTAA